MPSRSRFRRVAAAVRRRHAAGFLAAWLVLWVAPGVRLAAQNLIANPGFEAALEPAWEKRTPEDAGRRLYREEDSGRTGAAAVLENLEPAYTRLRQGHDRSIRIAPGSLIELSAWIRAEPATTGLAMLQVYCMDAAGGILAQPTSRPVAAPCDWTRRRVQTVVPAGTDYVMAYLQIRDAVGRVRFDDVELVVKRPPLPRPPLPRIALLTDLPDDHATIREARTLFEEGLKRLSLEPPGGFEGFAGALVLIEGEVPAALWDGLTTFAGAGGRVFMDLRAFARCQGREPSTVELGPVDNQPWDVRLAAGLRVMQVAEATAGFAVGQIMPRAGWPEGRLMVLPPEVAVPGLEVLAVAPGGQPGLVRLAVGAGAIVAADVLSLREPMHRHVDAYYKFTPVSGALGNPVRLGQYYPRKLSYDDLIEDMRRLAAAHDAITLEAEGAASEQRQLWSLNLGRPGAPLYFLYAAAHGSEWEPGYGLLTFAQRLAEGALDDAVDLQQVRIKIIPILNPSGYERMRRQNAQGVDLNRQGDYAWESFQGRDSNQDGVWGPGDYDWKGTAPFTEPEALVYQRIAALPNLYCVLDFHGNSGATNNKLAILPTTAKPDNDLLAFDLQRLANDRLRGRHLLRQNEEDFPSQYLLDRVHTNQGTPVLLNTSARNRYGLLIELTAGYGNSYGTVLQTDVTCELCRALFLAYPPPPQAPR